MYEGVTPKGLSRVGFYQPFYFCQPGNEEIVGHYGCISFLVNTMECSFRYLRSLNFHFCKVSVHRFIYFLVICSSFVSQLKTEHVWFVVTFRCLVFDCMYECLYNQLIF